VTEAATGAAAGGDVDASPAGRFPCFDGFRAAAALSVLVFHVAATAGSSLRSDGAGPYLARLDVGVAVFFLISGFLLYRPFVAAHLDGGSRPAPASFFKRRFLRIFPAYWLATTAVVYVFSSWAGGSITDLKRFVLYYSLMHSYNYGTIFAPLLQAWTLATEVAFYLFLPLWAFVIRRLATGAAPARRLRVELTGLAVLFVVSFAYRAVVLVYAPDHRAGQLLMWLPAWLDLFAVGMALAVTRTWHARRGNATPFGLGHPAAPATCWALAAVAFWVVSTRIGIDPSVPGFTTAQDIGVHELYGLTAFFFLLPGVFGAQDEGLIRRVLRSRVAQSLGLVSYGIYLWHENWISEYLEWRDLRVFAAPFWPMLGAVLALTLASAALSYVLIERPALRLKHQRLFRVAADRR
jgi:peptidoglycan/LPS O-acetylase OafA/YrhL